MLAKSLLKTRWKPFDDSINRFEGRQGLKSQVDPLADGLYGILPKLTRHLCPSHLPMVLPMLIQEKRLCGYEVKLLGSIRGSVLSNSHCLQMERALVIFRGKEVRITFLEKLRYDRRVAVTFQENAWCDEKVMDGWVCQHWKPS